MIAKRKVKQSRKHRLADATQASQTGLDRNQLGNCTHECVPEMNTHQSHGGKDDLARFRDALRQSY